MLVLISSIENMVQTELLLEVGICIKYSNEALLTKAYKNLVEGYLYLSLSTLALNQID